MCVRACVCVRALMAWVHGGESVVSLVVGSRGCSCPRYSWKGEGAAAKGEAELRGEMVTAATGTADAGPGEPGERPPAPGWPAPWPEPRAWPPAWPWAWPSKAAGAGSPASSAASWVSSERMVANVGRWQGWIIVQRAMREASAGGAPGGGSWNGTSPADGCKDGPGGSGGVGERRNRAGPMGSQAQGPLHGDGRVGCRAAAAAATPRHRCITCRPPAPSARAPTPPQAAASEAAAAALACGHAAEGGEGRVAQPGALRVVGLHEQDAKAAASWKGEDQGGMSRGAQCGC